MLYLVVYRLVNVYETLIVIWALMSWIPTSQGVIEDIRSALGALVEPYLSIFRRYIPPIGGIDFSPVVAIVVLNLLMRVIAYIL